MHKILSAMRIFIGSVFIIAAVLKLISIDEFEIYVYSFDIFNFISTTFLSRLLIAGEFILGLFLIFKIHYKLTWHATLILQILFTLFLTYVALFRSDSNCHCFGELVELSPVESIIKNIVMTIFLIAVRRQEETNSRHKRIMLAASSLIPLVLVFVVTPPDSIYKKIYSTEKDISSLDFYESFDEIVRIDFADDTISFDSTSVFNIRQGKHIIAVVSSGCKYCKLGVKRLSMMAERKEKAVDDISIFIWGSPRGIMDFREETLTEEYSYWHIMPGKAIDITYGRFPIFITMEGNDVVSIGDFREL